MGVVVPMAGPATAAGSSGTDVPMVTLGDVRVFEGDAGRRVAKVPITLSRPMDSTAYFSVETVDGEKMATPDVDYEPVVKRVRIPAGATHKTVGIPFYGDAEQETAEFVELRITPLDAPEVGFNKWRGSVVIGDDDTDGPVGPTVSVSSVRRFEGNPVVRGEPSHNKVQLALTLSEPQTGDVFVTWHTEATLGTPGDDYKHVPSKTTRIPAGKLQKTILVDIRGDDVVEGDEDVNVIIDGVSGGSGVTIGLGRGLVLVMDDDGDGDGDGLVDNAEGIYKTDPGNADTDGDGLQDLQEIVLTRTNPNQFDTDADGLGDLHELKLYETDPLVDDTDGDSWVDGAEVALGSDPLDSASFPA